jgi:hypothetical protein
MFHIVLVMLLVNRECRLYRTPPEEHVQILIDQRQSFLRFRVLVGEVGVSTRNLTRQSRQWRKFGILAGNVLSDYIHIVLSILSKYYGRKQ